MARCRKCNAVIPDATEYCSECEKENKESYLDNLLNSVAPDEDAQMEKSVARIQEMIQRKKPKNSSKNKAVKDRTKKEKEDVLKNNSSEDKPMDEDSFERELTDNKRQNGETEDGDLTVSEFQNNDLPEREPMNSDLLESELIDKKQPEAENPEKIFPGSETTDLPIADMEPEEISTEHVSEGYDIFSDEKNDEDEFDRMFQDLLNDSNLSIDTLKEDAALFDELAKEDTKQQKTDDIPSEFGLQDLPDDGNGEETMVSNEPSIEENAASDELGELMNGLLSEESELQEEESREENTEAPFTMEDLDQSLEQLDMPEMKPNMDEEDDSSLLTQDNEEEINEEQDDDILELVNSIQNYDYLGDGQSLSDIQDTDGYGTEEALEKGQKPNDIADIFDTTLGAVNALTDHEQKEASAEEKKEKKTKKPGLFRRIFGNIKTERSEEEIARMKEKILQDAEAKEKAEEEKKLKAAADKEAKKQKAAEDKAAAAKKKQENAQKKAEDAKLKKDAKEKKKQEIQNLIDEIDEDEGRINRVGASIVFVIFAAAAAFIIIGTRIYSYAASITIAEKEFENQRYNEAYEDVAGLEIKEDDQTFYLQVMTVMYTYKQLNSFNRYYSMKLYPEALDSLLKGLQRYDKYSALASVIEIETDMNFVRDKLVQQLSDVYGLSEHEAVKLAAMEDREAYSEKIYEIAGSIPEAESDRQIVENK